MTDNLDGTYLVIWKPQTSGTYTVALSHRGVPFANSPFSVRVTNSLPAATKCDVRGEALEYAVARASQTFEISFRDRLGQLAHAVDLDVFVEPLPPSSPRL